MSDSKSVVLAAYETAATAAQARLDTALQNARSDYDRRNAELLKVKEQSIERIPGQQEEQLNHNQHSYLAILLPAQKLRDDQIEHAHRTYMDSIERAEVVLRLGKSLLESTSPGPSLTQPQLDAEQFFLEQLQDTYDRDRQTIRASFDVAQATALAAYQAATATATEGFQTNQEIITAASAKEIQKVESAYRDSLNRSAKKIDEEKSAISSEFKQSREARLGTWHKFLSGRSDADAAIKALLKRAK